MFERFAWVSVLTACLIVLLSLASQGEPIESSVGLFWWRWVSLVSLLIGGGLCVLGWWVEKLSQQPIRKLLLWLAGIAVLGLTLWVNRSASQRLLGFAETDFADSRAMLAFVLALVALVLTVVWSRGRRWWYRGASILAVAAFGWWLWSQGVSTEDAGSNLPELQPSGQRLLVVGLDGADWRYIDPLMARGELPNLKRLVETGVRSSLATLLPTRSPALWTTMVTGKDPADHGIEGHTVVHARGGRHPMPGPEDLARGFGLPRLYAWLQERGEIVTSPATSLERRVPAFWNITTALDSPLDVINWWATWPAEAILGRMVTDRTYFWRWAVRGYGDVDEAMTFPETLYAQLAPMIMRPDQVGLDQARQFMDVDAETFASTEDSSYKHHELLSEFRYYYSMFETHRRIAAYFLERAQAEAVPPSDMMVIFRLVDMICHSSLKFSELVEDHLQSSPEDVRRFGQAVTEAYRQVDHVVGELVTGFGEGNVVVISDHGFRLEGKKNKRQRYNHQSGPSGIFLASGPAFSQGEVGELSLFHIMPILLATKGFPVPTDIVEAVPTQVFAPEFLAQHPVTAIDSYGSIRPSGVSSESVVDQEMMERLEALGYLD
jgi:hypothetical protein